MPEDNPPHLPAHGYVHLQCKCTSTRYDGNVILVDAKLY
jgi:hypothetical protein